MNQTTFIKFMREVKVTVIFYSRIKHGSFASLCIGENYVTVIRAIYKYIINKFKLSGQLFLYLYYPEVVGHRYYMYQHSSL